MCAPAPALHLRFSCRVLFSLVPGGNASKIHPGTSLSVSGASRCYFKLPRRPEMRICCKTGSEKDVRFGGAQPKFSVRRDYRHMTSSSTCTIFPRRTPAGADFPDVKSGSTDPGQLRT